MIEANLERDNERLWTPEVNEGAEHLGNRFQGEHERFSGGLNLVSDHLVERNVKIRNCCCCVDEGVVPTNGHFFGNHFQEEKIVVDRNESDFEERILLVDLLARVQSFPHLLAGRFDNRELSSGRTLF